MTEETKCPLGPDGLHCTCWYDGDECCYCEDGAMTDEQKEDQGMIEFGTHPNL